MPFVRIAHDVDVPAEVRGSVVTVGNFDGVHRGHQSLLAETVRLAKAAGVPSAVITFDPHPSLILQPWRFQPLLTTIEHRAEVICRYGIDRVLVLAANRSLFEVEAPEFFHGLLRGKLDVRGMVEGFNFHFGKDRKGTLDTLRAYCEAENIPISIVTAQQIDGAVVSSSRVRDELTAGHVERMPTLLGRPYRLEGVVSTGQQRGRTIGFPTANLESIQTVIPADGVYACWCEIDGKRHAAAVSIGPNPTFAEAQRKVEAYILDFAGDLYGRRFAIDFVARIRGLKKFAGVAELTAQIQADVSAVRRLASG